MIYGIIKKSVHSLGIYAKCPVCGKWGVVHYRTRQGYSIYHNKTQCGITAYPKMLQGITALRALTKNYKVSQFYKKIRENQLMQEGNRNARDTAAMYKVWKNS